MTVTTFQVLSADHAGGEDKNKKEEKTVKRAESRKIELSCLNRKKKERKKGKPQRAKKRGKRLLSPRTTAESNASV